MLINYKLCVLLFSVPKPFTSKSAQDLLLLIISQLFTGPVNPSINLIHFYIDIAYKCRLRDTGITIYCQKHEEVILISEIFQSLLVALLPLHYLFCRNKFYLFFSVSLLLLLFFFFYFYYYFFKTTINSFNHGILARVSVLVSIDIVVVIFQLWLKLYIFIISLFDYPDILRSQNEGRFRDFLVRSAGTAATA